MSKALDVIKRFAADESGNAMAEYTILVGIFVVAVITIMTTLGSWISAQWANVCNLTKGNC